MATGDKARIDILKAKQAREPLSAEENMELNNLLAKQGEAARATAEKARGQALNKMGQEWIKNNPQTSPTAMYVSPPKTEKPIYDVGDPLNYGLQPQTPGVTPESIARTAAELKSMNLPPGYDPIYAETARIAAAADAANNPAVETRAPSLMPTMTGRENPRWYPPMAATSGAAAAPKSEKTPVQKLIDSLKEETKANGPNFADFIEAASAGWQGKKAAYLEKQADLAARAADIGKLEKTAQLEEALNQERIKADVIKALVASGQLPMSSLEALGITGIQGVGGVSKGAAVGNMFAQGLGGD